MNNFHINIPSLKNVLFILLWCISFATPSNVQAMEQKKTLRAVSEDEETGTWAMYGLVDHNNHNCNHMATYHWQANISTKPGPDIGTMSTAVYARGLLREVRRGKVFLKNEYLWLRDLLILLQEKVPDHIIYSCVFSDHLTLLDLSRLLLFSTIINKIVSSINDSFEGMITRYLFEGDGDYRIRTKLVATYGWGSQAFLWTFLPHCKRKIIITLVDFDDGSKDEDHQYEINRRNHTLEMLIKYAHSKLCELHFDQSGFIRQKDLQELSACCKLSDACCKEFLSKVKSVKMKLSRDGSIVRKRSVDFNTLTHLPHLKVLRMYTIKHSTAPRNKSSFSTLLTHIKELKNLKEVVWLEEGYESCSDVMILRIKSPKPFYLTKNRIGKESVLMDIIRELNDLEFLYFAWWPHMARFQMHGHEEADLEDFDKIMERIKRMSALSLQEIEKESPGVYFLTSSENGSGTRLYAVDGNVVREIS